MFNKKIDINAEMMGKASFFVACRSDFRGYLQHIAITPASALTAGVNILATNGHYLAIFNDALSSSCISKVINGKGIAINCVYKKNGQLTEFIKDCRNTKIIKENIKARRKLTIRFLSGNKCKVHFNKKSHLFDCILTFPSIEKVFSGEHFKNSLVAHTFNYNFIQMLKHIDLSIHKEKAYKNNIIFSVSKRGLLVAAKKGVIFACMPSMSGFSGHIADFVTGSILFESLDIFTQSIIKKRFQEEFGHLLSNELLNRKIKR